MCLCLFLSFCLVFAFVSLGWRAEIANWRKESYRSLRTITLWYRRSATQNRFFLATDGFFHSFFCCLCCPFLESGYRFFSPVESYIVRYLKEKMCYVSMQPQRELEDATRAKDKGETPLCQTVGDSLNSHRTSKLMLCFLLRVDVGHFAVCSAGWDARGDY